MGLNTIGGRTWKHGLVVLKHDTENRFTSIYHRIEGSLIVTILCLAEAMWQVSNNSMSAWRQKLDLIQKGLTNLTEKITHLRLCALCMSCGSLGLN